MSHAANLPANGGDPTVGVHDLRASGRDHHGRSHDSRRTRSYRPDSHGPASGSPGNTGVAQWRQRTANASLSCGHQRRLGIDGQLPIPRQHGDAEHGADRKTDESGQFAGHFLAPASGAMRYFVDVAEFAERDLLGCRVRLECKGIGRDVRLPVLDP